MTISIPLISEATAGGHGGQAWTEYPQYLADIPYVNAETEKNDIRSEKSDDESPEKPDEQGKANDENIITEPSNVTEIRVLDSSSGEITVMPLEDYVTCVVAAEMPYTFNTEALKAQAVAARSYCLYKIEHGSDHDGKADACTSHSHCAAYITLDGLTDKYGSNTANKIWSKVSDAVSETKGEVITYKNKTALALFHSRSWEYTESSSNVWGGSYPYLTSVSTPEDDSITTVSVSSDMLRKAFSVSDTVYASSGGSATLTSQSNESGRKQTLSYLGCELKAKTLRSKLGLRSTDFTYDKTSDGYVFTVHGYGHGVGMSQYGANAMANSGSDYIEILTHYYSGVSVEKVVG